MADPDPITGKCSPDRGVLCRIANEHDIIGFANFTYFLHSLNR